MLKSTKKTNLINNVLKELKKSKTKLYLAITGGGTRAISMLLENGGASSYFLGANICYDQNDLREIAGSFAKAVSPEVAKSMTYAGFHTPSGYRLEDETKAVCISCTASLAKEDERKDRIHHAYIAASRYTKEANIVKELYQIKLKTGRTRLEEENLLSEFIVLLAFNLLTESDWHISTKTEAYELIGLSKEEIEIIPIIEKKKKKEEKDEPKEETLPSEE